MERTGRFEEVYRQAQYYPIWIYVLRAREGLRAAAAPPLKRTTAPDPTAPCNIGAWHQCCINAPRRLTPWCVLHDLSHSRRIRDIKAGKTDTRQGQTWRQRQW